MNTKCVVLLVSEQTIPNIVFLKWYFRNNPEQNVSVLFISSKQMEDKHRSENICNALPEFQNYLAQRRTILVNSDDYESILNEIKQYNDAHACEIDEYVVNITGGTKLMSLAAYSIFSVKPRISIFYVSLLTNQLLQLLPERKEYCLDGMVSIQEYFTAYGITAKQDSDCEKDWDFNKTVYRTLIEPYSDLQHQMFLLQNERPYKNALGRKHFVDLTGLNTADYVHHDELDLESIKSYVADFGFNPAHLTYRQQKYITGGWFEEYVFQSKCCEFGYPVSGDPRIALNVKISKDGVDNELDVVYIDTKNVLHIIECKSRINEKDQKELLLNTIYKAQALRSSFGLAVKSHFYTRSIISNNSIKERAKSFGIDIYDGTKFTD